MRELLTIETEIDDGALSFFSDGGMNLPTLSTMVGMLDSGRVKVVNHEELTEMARQRSAYLLDI